jgi:hypothetical protein
MQQGRVRFFELTTDSNKRLKMNPYPDLLVDGAVYSHPLVFKGFMLLLCAQRHGPQRLYIASGE